MPSPAPCRKQIGNTDFLAGTAPAAYCATKAFQHVIRKLKLRKGFGQVPGSRLSVLDVVGGSVACAKAVQAHTRQDTKKQSIRF